METKEYTATCLYVEELDSESRRLLMKAATWAKFLARVGFTFLGLFIVGMLAATIVITAANSYMEHTANTYGYVPGTISWLHLFVCLVVALIYFFPLYYLYRFSVRIKHAIPENNQAALVDAFRFLNRHYAFIGILTLVMLFLLAVALTTILVRFFG